MKQASSIPGPLQSFKLLVALLKNQKVCIIPIFHWICLPCKHSNCLLFELPKLSDQMLIHRSKRHEWTPGNRTFTTNQWSSNPCGFTDQIPCPPWIKALLLHNNPVIYICMHSMSEKKRRKDCTAFSYHLKDFSGVNDCSIDGVTVPTPGGFLFEYLMQNQMKWSSLRNRQSTLHDPPCH